MARRIAVDRPPEWHWPLFVDFVKLEIEAGGPDPHMHAMAYLSKNETDEEKLWRAMAYISCYNVPAAEYIWDNWPWTRVEAEKPADFWKWVQANWEHLPMRKERRPIRSPKKLGNFLSETGPSFVSTALDKGLEQYHYYNPNGHSSLYNQVQAIPSVGRYSGMKVCETLRLLKLTSATSPDMNPKGGWAPRLALSFFYPKHTDQLNADDQQVDTLALCDDLFDDIIYRLREEDIRLTPFVAEVMLCDYKQAVNGSQYPGKSQDSELAYLWKVGRHLTESTYYNKVRPALIPWWARGEVRGWDGVRKELAMTVKDHDYMWSDKLYDYELTTDLAHPLKWRPMR